MSVRSWRIRRLGIVFVGALVVLVGAIAASRAVGSTTATPGQTLTMDRALDITGFDPVTQIDFSSIYSDLQVYNRLVELAPDGKTLVPGLASRWAFSDQGREITFTLRTGVKFSDGSPLTPADVVFSLKRATNPKSAFGSLFGGGVRSIVALGPDRVRITLAKPFAPVLSSLSLWLGSIYSKANWLKWGKAASQHPVGTGPYELASWTKGSQLVLVPNRYYWGSPKPTVAKIVFKVVGDGTARALALESGAADMIDVVPPNQVAAIKRSGSNVVSVPGPAVELISLNENTVPAFKDRNVRRALAYSINRAAVVKAAYFGQASRARSVFPSGTLFYDPKGAATYDIAKAAAYLKASGFAQGFSFKLTVPSGGSAEATIAQIWAADLAKLGIKLTIQTLDQTTALQEWSSEKYQATIMPWVNDTPDAFEICQYTVSATKPTGVTAFHTGYVNKHATALAQEAESALSDRVRQRDYSAIQRILNSDQPLLYVVDTPVLYGVSSKVHGFTPNRAGNGNYYFNKVTLSP